MKWYLALICKVVNTILQNFWLKWPDILNIHCGILLFLWVQEILTSNLIIFTKIIPTLVLQVINTNRVSGVYLLLYIYFFSETHNDFHKFILSPHMNYYGQWLIKRQNCYVWNLYSEADINGILSTANMILLDNNISLAQIPASVTKFPTYDYNGTDYSLSYKIHGMFELLITLCKLSITAIGSNWNLMKVSGTRYAWSHITSHTFFFDPWPRIYLIKDANMFMYPDKHIIFAASVFYN